MKVICNKADWDCINIDYAEKKLSLCKHSTLHSPVFVFPNVTCMDEFDDRGERGWCDKKRMEVKCVEVTGLEDEEKGRC